MEQTVQRERRIRIIPATKPASAPGRASGSKQRVAAYCRVSTDSEEQLTSYTAQKAYYTQKSLRILIGRWPVFTPTEALLERA